ncbi:hypothetical protein KKG56_05530 [bacterium]|nr:hypothetical protein [bacterium]
MSKESTSPIKNVIVQFDLPFVLRLVDSVNQETTPESYEQYTTGINNIPAMIRFEKKLRDLGGVQIATEDRRGLLNYSVVQVWFDKHFFEKYPFGNYRERSNEFIEAAIILTNHFLDSYRDATSSFWIRPIKRSELAAIRFIGLHHDGSQDPFTLGSLGTGLGLGALITKDEDKRIRERLTSGERTDELQRLAYVVTDLFDKEEFWSAALSIEIFFEAKVARILRQAFQKEDLSENEIDEKFEYSNATPRSITNLLKTYVPELTGVSIDDSSHSLGQSFENWCMYARNLRNDVAHGKILSVLPSQAHKAILAVDNFLKELEILTPDICSTHIIYRGKGVSP